MGRLWISTESARRVLRQAASGGHELPLPGGVPTGQTTEAGGPIRDRRRGELCATSALCGQVSRR